MEIKDYLHLYIGCKLQQQGGNPIILDYGFLYRHNFDGLTKPILRPLSDMTEDEGWEAVMIIASEEDARRYTRNDFNKVFKDWKEDGLNFEFDDLELIQVSRFINYLRSKQFDVDGLIPAGLAFDATTIKQ